MPLAIETFSNIHGGNAFFKAISHPLAAEKVAILIQGLKGKGPVAIYDPYGQAEAFSQFYDIKTLPLSGYYIQDVEKLGTSFSNHKAQLVTELKNSGAKSLFITSFDAQKPLDQIRHLLPAGVDIQSFDNLKLPEEMLSNARQYLSPINFATNFVFFRDAGGEHTRLVSANYWGGYGAKEAGFWCRLYDGSGKILKEWQEKLGTAQSTFILDSKEIRARFNLPEFTGQLFVHATKVQGHDIVKYALDTYGDAAHVLSCTHDANSWPSDYYAGLPAPDKDEEVILWVQNSQPFAIPENEIGMNVMGEEGNKPRLAEAIPPFATRRLSVAELLPNVKWPQQVEVYSGKYFVRPRYEVVKKGAPAHSRIAHINVEREDLKADPKLANLPMMGKGHILPAPVLPTDRFVSLALPTPMARGQKHLPLLATVYDAKGKKQAEQKLGNLPRNHTTLVDVSKMLNGKPLDGGYGHVELTYDFSAGQEADGWMHALFRYVDQKSGHAAESSFGSHMFNSALVYKNEPQSYAGRAPGLSTRLFLRLGQAPYDTFCHLIYPASTPWHDLSDTAFILTARDGTEIATHKVQIACGGSHLWKVSEVFSKDQLAKAADGYVIIRDGTCRLFGYHGLMSADSAFSLDHMFGF
jgi:hypothetical protein